MATPHGCDCDESSDDPRMHSSDCIWRLTRALVEECQRSGLSFRDAVVQFERVWTAAEGDD